MEKVTVIQMVNLLIEESGLQKKEIAEKMGKSPQALNDILKNGAPSTRTLQALFKAIDRKLYINRFEIIPEKKNG